MKGFMFTLMLVFSEFIHGQSTNSTGYSLFHKVPQALMREDMETDRPDITESPYTVDAGHIQLESDIIRYKSTEKGSDYNHQYLYAPFTVKLGLASHTDFQVGLESYRREYHKTDIAPEEHYYNCGSLSLRLKQNLMGNDSGRFALAIMPYVKMPANSFFSHHRFEGGIIIPAQFKINEKLSIGFQEELDIMAEDEDYELQGLQSLAVSYELLKRLKAIGETYYIYHFGGHNLENYLNVALQFSPWNNFVLDGGVMHGFQPGAEHQYYVGIAMRW